MNAKRDFVHWTGFESNEQNPFSVLRINELQAADSLPGRFFENRMAECADFFGNR